MNQINVTTKKFTEAVTIDLGQLPTVDTRIDFILTDGSNPVIAENKTFTLTIGTVNGELYKTDDDTVSYRYLKFDDNNVADSLAITMKMNGEEILNDTVSLTYQTSGGGSSVTVDNEMSESSPNPVANSTITQAINNKADNDYLCFTYVSQGGIGMVRLDKQDTPPTINLEYSTDKKTWTEYTWDGNTGATITLANIGDKVWWRGDNSTLSDDINYYQFVMTGLIEASGNIMSLLDKQLRKNEVPSYCFYQLLYGCDSLTKAPKLPATTLAKGCYFNMFYNCHSLTEAPELPATTLANYCYFNMFYGCSSLTKAPELPATTLANSCYEHMFDGCSSLTKAPELPATTLANSCYSNMFVGCRNINKIKVNFTSWVGAYMYITDSWLYDASTTGVFECPSALDCSTRDASHVPAGWTIVRTDSPKSITSPTTESSAETYDVSPNTPDVPVIAISSALTLNATNMASTDIAYAEIVLDVTSGATVTAGTNLTLVDEITAGKRNICVVRWSGGTAKMYKVIEEDLPQA